MRKLLLEMCKLIRSGMHFPGKKLMHSMMHSMMHSPSQILIQIIYTFTDTFINAFEANFPTPNNGALSSALVDTFPYLLKF